MNTVQDYEIPSGLWKPQREALEHCSNYLDKESPQKGFLVRMPTGTGKSGVIGILSHCYPKYKNVLILSPWTHLRDQIENDILQTKNNLKPKFWYSALNAIPLKWKSNFVLLPSKKEEFKLISRDRGTIITSTFKSLQDIWANDNKDFYNSIKSFVDLILVDECHYEPAPKWAQAVRGLEKPTILFTATPYRNDFKLLHINDADRYEYTHEKAEKEDKLIRKIKIEEFDFNYNGKDKFFRFAKYVAQYYKNSLKHISRVKKPKIIIRCDKSTQLLPLQKAFNSLKLKSIAIHDTFNDDDEGMVFKNVPDTKEHDAIVWIHQNKLLEGLDNSDFCLLAIYSRIGNERGLIQQIGRILRYTNREKKNEIAVVLVPKQFEVQNSWDAYRAYEKEREGTRNETVKIFNELLQLQPPAEYFDKKFRKRFDFNIPNPSKLIKYKLSTNIYLAREKFIWDEFLKNLEDELHKEDRFIQAKDMIENKFIVIIYAYCGNSPYLIKHSLFEFKLGYCYAKLDNNILYYYDSEGLNYIDYFDKTVNKIPADEVFYLFPKRGSTAKEVSLKNIISGDSVLTSRVIRGHNVEKTAGSLNDSLQICTRVFGQVPIILPENRGVEDKVFKGNSTRRYVSINSSKLTDADPAKTQYESVNIDLLKIWLDKISKTLSSREESIAVITRYAIPYHPTEEIKPEFLIFDFFDEDFKIFDTSSGNEIIYEERGLDIHSDDNGYFINFKVIGNVEKNNEPAENKDKDDFLEEEYKITLRYSDKKKKFFLSNKILNQRYTIQYEEQEGPFIKYVNRYQNFKIFVNSGEGIYYGGNFYGIDYRIVSDLGNTLITKEFLDGIDSEKGKNFRKGNFPSWPSNSIYNRLDPKSKNCEFINELDEFEYFICDDPAPEAADFIGITFKGNGKIIFIHAKDCKSVDFAPAALQEVFSQAIKSVSFLTIGGNEVPPKLMNWNNYWSQSEYKVKRIRKSPTKIIKPEKLWTRVKSRIINNPNSDKEIWLVIGNGLYKSQVIEMSKNSQSRNPKFSQFAHLYNHLWGHVTEHGIKLKIYCH